MADISELDKKVTVTWGLLKGAATAIVVTTFTITTVYWNFQSHTRELEFMKEKQIYERDRTDRKINPVEDRLIRLETKLMLEKLEILKEENEILKKRLKIP